MSSLVDYVNVIITHNYEATCKNLSFTGIQACEMELLQYPAYCGDRKGSEHVRLCECVCACATHLLSQKKTSALDRKYRMWKIFATREIRESRICIFIEF